MHKVKIMMESLTQNTKVFSFISECSLKLEYVEEGILPFSSDPMLYWKEVPQALDPIKTLQDKCLVALLHLHNLSVFTALLEIILLQTELLGTDSFRLMLLITCNNKLFEKFPAI